MRGLVQIVLGLILAVAGAIWAGPAKGVLEEPSARVFGEFAGAVPVGLALAGGLYILTGLLTMVLSAIGGLFAAGAARKDIEKQLSLFHELLAGAIVRMVGADGIIQKSELAMVSGVLEKFGQTPIPEKTIRSISESFIKDPERYLNRMQADASKISDEQKTHILRACILVAMSDVSEDKSELDYLASVAKALDVSEDRLAKIRDELASVAQKLVSAAAFAA
jgi:uncharacterized tellurite resistance protein B-like protein